jgi:drug/metabolite transporter, DME family
LSQDAKPTAPAPLSPSLGRLLIALAAVLWSTSGFFSKVLTLDTSLGLNTPLLNPLHIAFYRGLFATLALLPVLRRGDVSWRPLMLPMVMTFAVMNVTFVSAMALGTAANAILLQYTAPLWIFLVGVWWLGERVEPRGTVALLFGLLGIGVIVAGGWKGDDLPVIGLGLASGVTYGGVLLFLRQLRSTSPRWLTVLNHGGCALALLPLVIGHPLPTLGQYGWLFLFGALQMGLPYLLMAQGLRSVGAQEASTISLLEPLLNPLWAYLIAREEPSAFTLIGGAFILGALLWRYWPRRPPAEPDERAGVGPRPC